MPRYNLRTLLILLAMGPPLLAGAWISYQRAVDRRRQSDFDRLIDLIEKTVAPESWKHAPGPGQTDGFNESMSLKSCY
jgi:hypothetical protein